MDDESKVIYYDGPEDKIPAEYFKKMFWHDAARATWAKKKSEKGFKNVVQIAADEHGFDECVRRANEND